MYRGDGTDADALALTARTSVPVILYTTEQIFCAHFMVRLFRRWLARVERERERGSGTARDAEEEEGDGGESGDGRDGAAAADGYAQTEMRETMRVSRE